MRAAAEEDRAGAGARGLLGARGGASLTCERLCARRVTKRSMTGTLSCSESSNASRVMS